MSTATQLSIRRYADSERALLTRWILGSYWGGWMNAMQIRIALQHSLTFVADSHDGPRGFIRIVTDYATFSAITDLYVDEPYRRQGVGRALMEHILRDTGVPKTICILTTRDAKGFYAKFGFVAMGGDAMKRDPSR